MKNPRLIGIVISLGVLCLSVWVVENRPLPLWEIGGPLHAPEALVLPWIPGPFSLTFVVLCAAVTAAAIRLDRGRRSRVEPLALVALCLSVLGHAQGVRAASVIGSSWQPVWPLNLTGVAVGLLIGAAAVGVVAWVRILISKRPVRGRMFATSAVFCSLCSAWWIDTFLADPYWGLGLGGAVELPIVYHSGIPTDLEPPPEILIQADGTVQHEPLADLAKAMARDFIDHQAQAGATAPDEPVLIRADRRARWGDVQAVIDELHEVLIWRIQIATRWAEPATETRVFGFLPVRSRPMGVGDHLIRIGPSGELSLDDESCEDQQALLDRLERLPGGTSGEVTFEVRPDDAASLGSVLSTVSTLYAVSEVVTLGHLWFWAR